MRTKAQIVQELLDRNAISAEDAVVLLTPEYKNPFPVYQPKLPRGSGDYTAPPWEITCGDFTFEGDILPDRSADEQVRDILEGIKYSK